MKEPDPRLEGYFPITYGFRPGTQVNELKQDFIFHMGGMGDYVCWSAALKFAHDNYPHLKSIVWGPEWFLPFLREVLGGDKCRFTLQSHRKFEQLVLKGEIPQAMGSFQGGLSVGTHPIDYGFQQFCNLNPPPEEWNFMPEVSVPLPEWFTLSERQYVVLHACSTTPIRTMPPSVFNALKIKILNKGMTPVILGKTEMDGGTEKKFLHAEYDFSDTLNLIDKTTMLEAQAIMSRAHSVVGLDNGLLHLAATSSVPILFGYNIASIEHRAPRRREGITLNLAPSEQELPCVFCQSKMRYTNHSFDKCTYEDMACLTIMNAEGWTRAFERLCELINEEKSEAGT